MRVIAHVRLAAAGVMVRYADVEFDDAALLLRD
jgi:hypothetical protein